MCISQAGGSTSSEWLHASPVHVNSRERLHHRPGPRDSSTLLDDDGDGGAIEGAVLRG